jgi:hypothetical protein
MSGNWQSSGTQTVKPGEIWLIEQSPEAGFTPLNRDALNTANVVLYDRALGPLIAENLPLGTYAEPLSPVPQSAESVISPRAQHFAEEGWSVVQIVAARSGWRERVYNAVERLGALRKSGEFPIRVVPKAAPTRGQPQSATCLRSLPALIDEFRENDPLTLIFGPLTVCGPTPSQAFTANGLAG